MKLRAMGDVFIKKYLGCCGNSYEVPAPDRDAATTRVIRGPPKGSEMITSANRGISARTKSWCK